MWNILIRILFVITLDFRNFIELVNFLIWIFIIDLKLLLVRYLLLKQTLWLWRLWRIFLLFFLLKSFIIFIFFMNTGICTFQLQSTDIIQVFVHISTEMITGLVRLSCLFLFYWVGIILKRGLLDVGVYLVSWMVDWVGGGFMGRDLSGEKGVCFTIAVCDVLLLLMVLFIMYFISIY